MTLKPFYWNFDGLDVTFQGRIPQAFVDVLEAAKAEAQNSRAPVLVEWQGEDMHVAESGAKGGYAYRCDTEPTGATWFFSRNQIAANWNIRVSARSNALAAMGLEGVRAEFHRFLAAIGAEVRNAAISRVDYCMDFLADDMEAATGKPFRLDPYAFVMHSHTSRADHMADADKQVHGVSGRCTSVTCGKLPGRQIIVCEKSREIRAMQKPEWWSHWNAACTRQRLSPMTGEEQVWRVELRAGKDRHRQLDGPGGLRYSAGMTSTTPPCYAGFRFPPAIISHAVWLYFRFPLSLRMVEEMLAARGIAVSHETVRQWGLKFGQAFANQIRRKLPRPGDKWHLNEVAITIAGQRYWLWRAVDQHGQVLDILVQSRRNTAAAKRLLCKLLKRQGWAPWVMITDKLGSYAAAKRTIMPGVEHRQHKGLNNRAENSHQPTRRREQMMNGFKSPGQAERFLAVHDQVANLFRRPADLSNTGHRRHRAQAFQTWAEGTGLVAAA